MSIWQAETMIYLFLPWFPFLFCVVGNAYPDLVDHLLMRTLFFNTCNCSFWTVANISSQLLETVGYNLAVVKWKLTWPYILLKIGKVMCKLCEVLKKIPSVLQLDVIIADLDGGSIHFPEHITAPRMPEPAYSRSLTALFTVRVVYLAHWKLA